MSLMLDASVLYPSYLQIVSELKRWTPAGPRIRIACLSKTDKAPQSTSQSSKRAIKPLEFPHGNRRNTVINQPGETTTGELEEFKHLMRPTSHSSIQATICNIVDSLITRFLDPPELEPAVDPTVQLAGNLAPVEESPPQRCHEVTGVLPADLNGIYIRNGPNGGKVYGKGGHHLFDGDGMLHGVRIKDGTATYCCRHVQTSRFVQEKAAGRPLVPRFFGGFNGASGLARGLLALIRVVLGLLDLTKGWGLANTSVIYFNNKILALSEDDMPYVIRVTQDGDLVTVGKLQLKPWKMNMCAHPKIDPITEEMFAFSFNPSLPPFSFFRLSAHGEAEAPDVSIPCLDITLVHDFAITEKYIVFPSNQFVVKPLAPLFGTLPIGTDRNKIPRFLVLPRHVKPEQATAQAKWFEMPGCNSLHYLNAWDEEEMLVVITSVLSPPEFALEIPADKICCMMTEIRLNIRTGETSHKVICSENLEFGAYNHGYTGKKMRYAYMSTGSFPRFSGVVKVDLQLQKSDHQECIVSRREYGRDCYGSEPFFVPRGSNQGEDYGYLLSIVHNEATGISKLLVMDAQSPSLHTLACVKLPGRVPYGFHGYFVSETQLSQQDVPP